MKKFSNYNEVEVNDFVVQEKIEVGGHYCKIINVEIQNIHGKTKDFDIMVVKFDTDDNDKKPQFYAKRYKNDTTADAMKAKWKGNYKVFIPLDDGSEADEKTKQAFKSFITSIEKSNPGYSWEKADWDEKTLIGKKFIGVFGVREFEAPDGRLVNFTECRFVRSTENDPEVIQIPKVKLLDGTLMDYDDWCEKKEQEKDLGDKIMDGEFTVSDSGDDLPF